MLFLLNAVLVFFLFIKEKYLSTKIYLDNKVKKKIRHKDMHLLTAKINVKFYTKMSIKHVNKKH